MPMGRYPGRVKPFRKWAQEKMDNAELSDSATPHNAPSTSSRGRGRKWRLKRRRRKRNKDG